METAYTTTVHSKTADLTLTESVKATSTSGSDEAATVTGSGQLDLTDGSFELHLNSPSGGSEEVLETGSVLYVQVPPAEQAGLPGHKAWESIDLHQLEQAKLGTSFSQLSSLRSDNPAQVLSDLSSVSNGVAKLGSVTVAGVPTTGYRAEVNLDKVADKAGGGADGAQVLRQEAKALGTSDIPVTVWIDSKGLIRRLREETPIPAASSGATDGKGTATVTMTFSNFGTAVQLTPPASDEVTNVTAQALSQ